jgi:hypothetical protein
VGTTEAALNLLARARTAADVRAAIAAAAPGRQLRETLVTRYEELAAHPRRDPGAETRAELLVALRDMITVADSDRLERALVTYEYGSLGENCAKLRAAALIALAGIDPARAELHAVHLLGDGHTEKMSAEPALTAVRFLVERRATPALYLFALGAARQDLLAEALRALVDLPAGLVVELAERLRESDDEIALLGLFDLLTAHPEPAAFAGFVRAWGLATDRLDVLGFAAAQIVATRRAPLVAALEEVAALTTDPAREELLREALGR